MNIAWLSSDPVTVGALGVTDRIEGARHLARAGHRVHVVCGAAPGAEPIDGIETALVETEYRPFLAWTALWPGVTRELSRLEPSPDVVITDSALLPAAYRWARRVRSNGSIPRVILDVRSHPVEAGPIRLRAQRARFRATLRTYGRRVDAITTISVGLRAHVADLTGLPAERISVWASGCSWCDRLESAPARPPELEGIAGRFVVVYQGSLSAGRGLFEAVEAVAIARRAAPELLLVFLGAGPGREGLGRRVADLGLQDHVLFVGPVPHERVPEFLGAAHVGLSPWPATWDMEVNSPLKLAEYLCFGLPVVLTAITPHTIVPPGAPFAFWAAAARPCDIAGAFLAAYGRRAELPALGLAARDWARPRLGWSAQFAILEGVLASLDVSPRGRPAAGELETEPGRRGR